MSQLPYDPKRITSRDAAFLLGCVVVVFTYIKAFT